MAFFGAEPEMVAAMAAGAEHDDGDGAIEIHSDNGPAFSLFCALASQWRLCATENGPLRTGIEYGAVEMAARVMRIDLDTENFARLRVLEAAALDAWSGQRADDRRAAR